MKPCLLCLGNITNDFTVDNVKKIGYVTDMYIMFLLIIILLMLVILRVTQIFKKK